MVKLVKKTRAGSKVRRIHDDPQTPYHRALASESVSDEVKNRLKQPYATLNPVALKIQGPTAVALSSARRSGRSATACSTLAAWRVTRHGRARRGHLTAPYPYHTPKQAGNKRVVTTVTTGWICRGSSQDNLCSHCRHYKTLTVLQGDDILSALEVAQGDV